MNSCACKQIRAARYFPTLNISIFRAVSVWKVSNSKIFGSFVDAQEALKMFNVSSLLAIKVKPVDTFKYGLFLL